MSEEKIFELPLTVEQTHMVDYQFYTPRSTMYNLSLLYKFLREELDGEKMVEAINAVMKNHPSLQTRLHINEDGDIRQKYEPELFEYAKLERISEKEFDVIKENLIHPFQIIGGQLARARVFETEKNVYLFLEVHHIVFDGTSFFPFLNNLLRAYKGKSLPADDYYGALQQRLALENTPEYQEAKAYFEEKYAGVEWQTYPTIDQKSRENESEEFRHYVPLDSHALTKELAKTGINKNEFFITVGLLATHIYNNYADIKLSWIFNGREGMAAMRRVGLYFRDLPVAIRFSEDLTVEQIYAEVKQQVADGIKHSCYPYNEIQQAVVKGDSACVLYQGDMHDFKIKGFTVEVMDIGSNMAASQNILDIEVEDGQAGLTLLFDYKSSLYKEESLSAYSKLYEKITMILSKSENQALTIRELKEKLA